MDIWSIDKLILIIVFFIPDFISIKIYSLIIPQRRNQHYTEILDALFYSSINYALLSWFIYLIIDNKLYSNHFFYFIISAIFILVIFPILLPIIFVFLRNFKWLKRNIVNPISKPWDYVFSR